MASTTKKRRLMGSCNGVPLDRLSTIPDSTIGCIFSFLPTKEAVRTSILSRGWMYLWTTITSIDLDDGLDDLDVRNIEDPSEHYVIQKEKFVHFVYYVLSLLNSPRMQKFSLNCVRGEFNLYVNTFMHAASRHDVEQLDVCVCDGRSDYDDSYDGVSVKFPGNIFFWMMLKLKGSSIRVDKVTNTAVFPKLKTLHLLEVEYEDDESLPTFLSACPVLRDLFITKVFLCDNTVTTILSSSLVNLDIELWDEEGASDCHLKIIAPALRFLKLRDNVSAKFSFENLSSLETADLDVSPPDPVDIEPEPVVHMLNGIANVRSLKVSDSLMQVLNNAPELGFKFSHLMKLEASIPERYMPGLCRLLDCIDPIYKLKAEIYNCWW